MDTKNILQLLAEFQQLGIVEQIDYKKFHLYGIITHSTAIEGSTVTEIENQLLFDEGITSSKRMLQEQQMNLDLKAAYERFEFRSTPAVGEYTSMGGWQRKNESPRDEPSSSGSRRTANHRLQGAQRPIHPSACRFSRKRK